MYAKIRAETAAYEEAKAEADPDRVNVIPEEKRRSRKSKAVMGDPPPPKGVAEIRETPTGPIIVGTVPVIKRTKPYVRRMTLAEAEEAARKAAET